MRYIKSGYYYYLYQLKCLHYCFTITFSLNDSGFQHFTGDLAAIKSLAQQRICRSLKNVLSGLSQVDRYILPVILITEQQFCHQTHLRHSYRLTLSIDMSALLQVIFVPRQPGRYALQLRLVVNPIVSDASVRLDCLPSVVTIQAVAEDPQIQVRVSMALYTCSLPARAHASTHAHKHIHVFISLYIHITYACVHGSVQYMRSLNRVRVTYIRHGTLYTSHIHVFMPPCICSLPYTLVQNYTSHIRLHMPLYTSHMCSLTILFTGRH